MHDYKDASVGDLNQMFSTSIIKYDGEPMFVNTVTDKRDFKMYDLPTFKTQIIKNITDKKFDFTPVRLGFINLTDSVIFASRIPNRTFSQGLTRVNLRVNNLPVVYTEADSNDINDVKHLKGEYLYKTIKQDFPQFEECLKLLEKRKSIAFSPHFVLTEEDKVIFKTEEVGMVNRDNGIISFFRSKRYLNFLLEETKYA